MNPWRVILHFAEVKRARFGLSPLNTRIPAAGGSAADAVASGRANALSMLVARIKRRGDTRSAPRRKEEVTPAVRASRARRRGPLMSAQRPLPRCFGPDVPLSLPLRPRE